MPATLEMVDGQLQPLGQHQIIGIKPSNPIRIGDVKAMVQGRRNSAPGTHNQPQLGGVVGTLTRGQTTRTIFTISIRSAIDQHKQLASRPLLSINAGYGNGELIKIAMDEKGKQDVYRKH
jgi:hypothetical protein